MLKQCESNENLLREYVGLPEDLLIEAINKDADCFLWVDIPASKTDPTVSAQDGETLAQAAREYRTFGASEANLALAREVLGPGFSEYMLLQAIRSNAIRLAAPSEEEKTQWVQEDQEREQLRLRNLDVSQLKQEVKDGYMDRRAAAQAAEADRVFAAKEKHDQMVGGFPPLPDTFKGRRLDRDFFVKMRCTREELKFLTQKFGQANIEARIRGLR